MFSGFKQFSSLSNNSKKKKPASFWHLLQKMIPTVKYWWNLMSVHKDISGHRDENENHYQGIIWTPFKK